MLSYLSLKLVAAADDPDYAAIKKPVEDVGLPLPLASARPDNADPGMDCSIKELAGLGVLQEAATTGETYRQLYVYLDLYGATEHYAA